MNPACSKPQCLCMLSAICIWKPLTIPFWVFWKKLLERAGGQKPQRSEHLDEHRNGFGAFSFSCKTEVTNYKSRNTHYKEVVPTQKPLCAPKERDDQTGQRSLWWSSVFNHEDDPDAHSSVCPTPSPPTCWSADCLDQINQPITAQPSNLEYLSLSAAVICRLRAKSLRLSSPPLTSSESAITTGLHCRGFLYDSSFLLK